MTTRSHTPKALLQFGAATEHFETKWSFSSPGLCAVVLMLSFQLSACDRDPACVEGFAGTGTQPDMRAPGGLHVAQSYETFCNGPGTAQDTFFVSVRGAGELPAEAEKVFAVSDDPPIIHWVNASELEIEVKSFSTVLESKHDAEGVHIRYSVDLDTVRSELELQQQRMEKAYPADAVQINAPLQQEFDRFASWAHANANVDGAK